MQGRIQGRVVVETPAFLKKLVLTHVMIQKRPRYTPANVPFRSDHIKKVKSQESHKQVFVSKTNTIKIFSKFLTQVILN